MRLFEVGTFFKSLTFGGFLSAALGNADAADTGFAADLLIVRAIETTIGGATSSDLRGTTTYTSATASSNVLYTGAAGGTTAAASTIRG